MGKSKIHLEAELIEIIRNGHYTDIACAAVGIHPATMRNWLQRGQAERDYLDANPFESPHEEEAPYLSFSINVGKALAESAIRALGVVTDAMDEGDVKAAQWLLERKFPEHWSGKQRHEISGPGGGPVAHQEVNDFNEDNLTNEEKIELERLLKKGINGPTD